MKRAFTQVRALRQAAQQPIRVTPGRPTEASLALDIRLIDEEVNRELLPALRRGDMIGIADGIADSIVVLLQAALDHGIPMVQVWEAVASANFRKVDPETGTMKKDAGGKFLKPDGWYGPEDEIKAALIAAGMASEQDEPYTDEPQEKKDAEAP